MLVDKPCTKFVDLLYPNVCRLVLIVSLQTNRTKSVYKLNQSVCLLQCTQREGDCIHVLSSVVETFPVTVTWFKMIVNKFNEFTMHVHWYRQGHCNTIITWLNKILMCKQICMFLIQVGKLSIQAYEELYVEHSRHVEPACTCSGVKFHNMSERHSVQIPLCVWMRDF